MKYSESIIHHHSLIYYGRSQYLLTENHCSYCPRWSYSFFCFKTIINVTLYTPSLEKIMATRGWVSTFNIKTEMKCTLQSELLAFGARLVCPASAHPIKIISLFRRSLTQINTLQESNGGIRKIYIHGVSALQRDKEEDKDRNVFNTGGIVDRAGRECEEGEYRKQPKQGSQRAERK